MKCLQLSNLPAAETFISHTANAIIKSNLIIHNDSITISVPKLSVSVIQIPFPKTQTIALQQGWNLISTNVYPFDSTITTLFNGLNIQSVKDMNYFWLKGENNALNGLKTIQAGNGYFINMNAEGTLSVIGIPMRTNLDVRANNNSPLQTGWQMIGCPYQTIQDFSSFLNATQSQQIKNFDGFWIPNGTTNSISTFIPGKGYLLKK